MNENTMIDCQNLLALLATYSSFKSGNDPLVAQRSVLRAIEAMIACDPEAQKADLEKLL